MSFGRGRGRGDQLAFCRPGHSQEWVPVELELKEEGYLDLVFSSKRNVFTCLTKSYIHDLDLRILDSPKIDLVLRLEADETGATENEHLVYAEHTDELFLLSRCLHIGDPNSNEFVTEARTLGFNTCRVEKENEMMRLVPCSLEGLSLFVGTNHSFAISTPHLNPNSIYSFAISTPHLNPNSIYFTDDRYFYTEDDKGGDVGIFNCADRTFSNCYYPYLDFDRVHTIQPPPIWFTPTLP